jgi:hypothetical protein
MIGIKLMMNILAIMSLVEESKMHAAAADFSKYNCQQCI